MLHWKLKGAPEIMTNLVVSLHKSFAIPIIIIIIVSTMIMSRDDIAVCVVSFFLMLVLPYIQSP